MKNDVEKDMTQSEKNTTASLEEKLKSARKLNFLLGSIIVVFIIIRIMLVFGSKGTVEDTALDFQPPSVFDPQNITEDQTTAMINNEAFHINISMAYFNADLLDRAIEEGMEVLRINPASVVGMNNLGYYHYSKGDYEEAKRYYRDALSISPNHDLVKSNLFLMYNVLKENAATEQEKARLQDELDNILASVTRATSDQ